MKKSILAASLATLMVPGLASANLGFNKLWTYAHLGEQKSEIVAFDDITNTLWVAGVTGVDILNATNGSFIAQIAAPIGGAINSVAIHNGLAAFAVESYADVNGGDRRNPGVIQFYDTTSRALTAGFYPNTVSWFRPRPTRLQFQSTTPIMLRQ